MRMAMRAHLLGVAGAGMAPLAGLLVRAGYEVSGSDVAFDPPMGPRLAGWGVRTMTGTDAAHLDGLDPARDLVVVGNVCRKDHPLAVEAEKRGLRRVSLPTALRELVFKERPVVAVSGTHGKTTTTAMLATALSDAGLDPGYLIGGVPVAPIAGSTEPFALGRASRSLTARTPLSPFVIEGDEYDSAFFEKQPKVWGYAPTMAILTSIEHDHVDIYPDEASYLAAFRGLLERLPEHGLLVANAGDRRVRALVEAAEPRARVVWYAASDVSGRPFPDGELGDVLPTWTASEVGLVGDGDPVQRFDLFVGPTSAGRFGVGAFGTHNVANALATIALAAEGFGLPVRDVASKLPNFKGTKRRLELLVDGRTSKSGVTLYDDFAHHPTAVETTLEAARARHRSGKLVALYEPRSATACRAMHQDAYGRAFDAADVIVLAPLGRSTIPEAERLDLRKLEAELVARKKTVFLAPSTDAVLELARAHATRGDAIVAMSNGAFGGVPHKLAEALA
jgi:UDP-N-acetylmuramate: L-alanyl-gamma-D-glutamyl-meso-diaminopimelate ligase